MIGTPSCKRWIWSAALLLLLGCKPVPPAAEPFVPRELLDAGEPPRAPLRYAVVDGTTTTATLSWKITPRETGASRVSISGLETLEIKAVAGPAELDQNEIRYYFEIVDSRAKAGTAASRKLVEDIEESGALLKGMGFFVAINDLGNILARRSDQKASEIPLRLLWMIYNTIDFVHVPFLPEEPVGIGGRWLVRHRLTLYGIQMVQESTYTLVERTDDEIVLDWTFERVGRRQVVDFAEHDALLEVESARMNTTGRIRLDLKSLGSNANLTGRINNLVVLVEDGVRENRTINEAFEFRARSTTTVREVESASE
jgi:hypothetical protein